MKHRHARRAIVSRVVAEVLESRRLFANDYTVGIDPRGSAIADFNLDGFADVAVANLGTGSASTVSLLRGRGDGTFQAATATTVGTLPYSIATADFNKDNKPDLVVGNLDGSYSILIGTGSGSFTTTTTATPGGVSVFQVIPGDYNGDTNPDFAFIDNNTDVVRVVLGNGAGGFGAPSVVNTGIGSAAAFAAGDVDADGDLDFAVSSGGFLAAVVRNNGSGTFAAAQQLTIDTQSYSIALRDLNGDNRADITVEGNATGVGSRINVLLATTTTAFTTAAPIPISNATDIQFVDLNGDTKLDIVTAGRKAAYGNGNGTFQTPFTTTTVNGFSPRYADLNKDGRPDYVAGVSTGASTNGVVSVRLNNGFGQFIDNVLADPTTFSGPSAPAQSVSDDFNNDGILDLAIANDASSGTVAVYFGTGTGTFTLSATLAVGSFPTNITSADFNGDNSADLATANGGGTVSVLINSGTGTFGAALSLPAGTSPADIGAGDFNGDGKQDLAITNQIAAGNLRTWRGNGDGTFQTPLDTALGVANPGDLDIADVTGDGRSDVAVAAVDGVGPTFRVLRASVSGNGTFTQTSAAILGGTGLSVAFGNFTTANGFGIDLVVGTNASGGSYYVLGGDGNGNFATPAAAALVTGSSPLRIVARDYNNDGFADLVTGSVGNTGSNGRVQVMLGFNNGVLAATPPITVANGRYVAPGDFNGDGRLDVFATNDFGPTNAMSVLLNQVPPIASGVATVVSGVLTVPSAGLSGIREAGGVLSMIDNSTNAVQYFNASAVKSVVVTGTPNAFNFTIYNDLGRSGGMRLVSLTTPSTPSGYTQSFSAQHLDTLTTPANSPFRVLTGGVKSILRVRSLNLGSGNTYLDLGTSDFVYDYGGSTPISSVRASLATARNNGLWNGYGITTLSLIGTTDMALGYMEASDYKTINGANATFSGEYLDNTAIVLRKTYYGDADLDGGVSINDFNRLSSNFGATGRFWAQGDFDYDNGVSINDFNVLSANFGKTLPANAPVAAARTTGVAPAKKR